MIDDPDFSLCWRSVRSCNWKMEQMRFYGRVTSCFRVEHSTLDTFPSLSLRPAISTSQWIR